jgi:hypothetical protein
MNFWRALKQLHFHGVIWLALFLKYLGFTIVVSQLLFHNGCFTIVV